MPLVPYPQIQPIPLALPRTALARCSSLALKPFALISLIVGLAFSPPFLGRVPSPGAALQPGGRRIASSARLAGHNATLRPPPTRQDDDEVSKRLLWWF